MSLAARNPSKGDHGFFRHEDYWRQCRSGNTVFDPAIYASHNLIEHHCRKEGVNSPVRFLSDNTPWRDPTTYARGVAEFSWGKEVWTSSSGTFSCVFDMANPEDPMLNRQVPFRFNWNGPFGVNSSEVENQAIAKALERIKDQKMGMGENIAQARQTYSMLEESAVTLLKAALAVKRGNASEAWRLLKDGRSVIRRGSDLWLQYQYGWKPLMSDIYGLHDLLKQRLKPPLIISGSGKSSRESINIRPQGLEIGSGFGMQQAQCKLYATVKSDAFHLADQVGLSNPLRLTWDLIPFSFVVDWVAPVGPVLDSLLPPAGLEFLGGFVGLKTEISVNSELHPGINQAGPPIKNSFQGYSYDRRKLDDWPRAGLWFIKNPLSSLSRGLSGVSLLIQKWFK